MTEEVIRELNSDKPLSDFHEKLLAEVMADVKVSRGVMSKYYSDWDHQDQVYRGLRQPDLKDVKAAMKGEPVKMIVPHTFAQCMTFTSFLFLLFTQNREIFMLTPSGDEDHGTKHRDCELVIAQNVRRNQFNRLLFQHLLDIARFGPAIFECSWTRDITRAYVTPEPVVQNVMGVETVLRADSEWAEFVRYEGNLIRNVSPYRFFPDTRFPLVDFQRGEFCASEEEYTMGQLYDLQAAGEVAGVERIEPLANRWDAARQSSTRTTLTESAIQRFDPTRRDSVAIVTKVQKWIVPNRFELNGGKKLGPEQFPILYHVWYANDNRLIRVEPAMWWHNRFGYTMGHFTADMHRTINLGLADLVYRLQDVITWLYNSRIDNVRRNLRGRNVINPALIDLKSYDGGGDIYLRQGANGAMIERAVMPLQTHDVTAGHVTDAQVLSQVMEIVTGVNGNAMGQYHTGRRSAREAAQVQAGASGRMKVHGSVIWDTSLAPLAQMMLTNARQSLPFESFQRIIGVTDPEVAMQRYQAFKGTPAEVICSDDYFIFDSTMPNERSYTAQALQELLLAIVQNPVASLQLNISPKKVLEETLWLRGGGTLGRFEMDEQEAQQLMSMFAAQQPPTQ